MLDGIRRVQLEGRFTSPYLMRLHATSERETEFRLFRVTRAIGGASDKIYPQSNAVTPHAIVHVVEVNCDKRRLQAMEASIHSVQTLLSGDPPHNLNHARKA